MHTFSLFQFSPSGRVLLIDLHGQSYMKGHVLRGTLNGRASVMCALCEILSHTLSEGRTVSKLLQEKGDEALIGPSSILGYLHTHGVPVSPHTPPATKPGGDADRPEEHRDFNGGNTVNQYGSHREGGVEAIQMEVGSVFRKDAEARRHFAAVLAAAMVTFANAYLLKSEA